MTNFNANLYNAWERFYETEDAKNPDESPYAKFDWDMGKNFISTLEMFKGFLISQGMKCKVARKAISGMDSFWTVAGLCVNVSKGVFDTFELHHAGGGSADLITVHPNSEWVNEIQAAAEAAEKQSEADGLWGEWLEFRKANSRNRECLSYDGSFDEGACFGMFAESKGYEAGRAYLSSKDYGCPKWTCGPLDDQKVYPLSSYYVAHHQKSDYSERWFLMSKELGEVFGISEGKIIRK